MGPLTFNDSPDQWRPRCYRREGARAGPFRLRNLGRLFALVFCYLASVVKKLSAQQKAYLVRKSLVGNHRKRRIRYRLERLQAAKSEFYSIRDRLPEIQVGRGRPGYASLDPPKTFSLYTNFGETLAFLMDLREVTTFAKTLIVRGRHVPVYANFAAIESIDAAGGLVLAAEIDRWTRIDQKRLNAHDDLWRPQIRDFFHDAGLFTLLNINPKTDPAAPTGPRQFALKYQTGTMVIGESADSVRTRLEELCGRSIGPRTRVYDAISEAMTNVAHHAYPKDSKSWPWVPIKRWWLGGSWSPDTNTVTVQMYDQGVGIPRTLPRSQHWSDVLPIVGRIDRERTEAGMIEAAMEYGRTSTGAKGRGKGLAQMTDWIRETGSGSLRIMSGRGFVTYLPGRSPIRQNLPAEFRGTLVEWEVCLDG